ncbi:MAG: chitobiase/beta-hexosaminidase C-terminal domain-containing protein [Oscillospiraceae bacterium]|nr:chitobiase/beta-hexosaminidase C-terminal domain-containing protein [Oscillospiraceae bacterium]
MTLKRRITVISTALLVMVAAAAFIIPGIAASVPISEVFGSLTVTYDQDDKAEVSAGLSYENNVLTLTTSAPVILSGTSVTDRVVVDGAADITLSGLDIDVSAVDGACALMIADDLSDDVTITLADGTENTLTSGEGCAGLQKNVTDASSCGKLMLNGGEANTGVLKAVGGAGGAGIGGGGAGNTAGIVINGGVITANGTDGGAGIGGGSVGACASVEINGGSIKAAGSVNSVIPGDPLGADIGDGFAYDGSVASHGRDAALVNSNGRTVVCFPIETNGEVVTINGVAHASEHDGEQKIYPYIAQEFNLIYVGDTNISGLYNPIDGTTEPVHLNVQGDDIVYGRDFTYKLYVVDDGNGGSKLNGILHILSDKPMTISGVADLNYSTDRDRIFIEPVGANVALDGFTIGTTGSVEITDGGYTYGCAPVTVGFGKSGNSYADNATTIVLNSGTTSTFKSGEGFSGIENGELTSLVIACESYGEEGHNCDYYSCGKLVASGGRDGAGIGGTNGSDITINGGCVIANGGENGAAIGGGSGVDGKTISINNAVVTARGGKGGAAIGGGKGGSASDIVINGGSVYTEVTALNGFDPAEIGGGASDSADGTAVTPTNGAAKVYLMEISNSANDAVSIDGVEYYPTQHGVDSDTNVYAYLTGEYHSVTKGNDTVEYTFDGTRFVTPDLRISGDELKTGVDFSYKGGVVTVLTDKQITVSMADGVDVTTDTIAVAKDVSASIVLDGVNITAADDKAAFHIYESSTGSVTVTLADGSENILVSGANCAGIQKNGTKGSLTVNGSGSLEVTGGENGAGIGGSKANSTANVTIEGGSLVVTGGANAPAIGGNTATGITVSGGSVTAVSDVAGIGGTTRATNIAIKGGSVKLPENKEIMANGNAVVPTNGAAASPVPVYLYKIEANGSVVKVDGEEYVPQSHSDADSNIYAYLTGSLHSVDIGGTLTNVIYDLDANAWVEIGTDLDLSCDEELVYNTDFTYPKGGALTIKTDKSITISMADGVDSTSDTIVVAADVNADITLDNVTINATLSAAFSIENASCGNVKLTIKNDNTLVGANGYAGIEKNGTGDLVGTLTISGDGSLDVNGGAGGAGIGASKNNATQNIVIDSGVIVAKGGEYAAGIGGGDGNVSNDAGNAENITVSGGFVTAIGMNTAAGIGGGFGGDAKDITISGGSVTAEGGERGAAIGAAAGRSVNGIIISGGSVKVSDKTFTDNGTDYFVPAFGSGVLNTDGRYTDGSAVTPTCASKPVFLIVVDTDGHSTPIYINDINIGITSHSDTDSNLYLYRYEELVTVMYGTDADTDQFRLYTDEYLPVPEADQFIFDGPVSTEYNSDPKEAVVSAIDPAIGDITVKYYDENGTELDSAPVDAGTYTVKIDVAKSEDYAEAEDLTDASWSFTIDKQEIDFPTYTVAEKVYDGTVSAKVSDLVFTDGNGVDLGFTSADYTVSGEFSDANADTDKIVTITVTLKETAKTKNYKLSTDTDVYDQGVITAAEIKVSGAVLYEREYDGTVDGMVESVVFKTVAGNKTISDLEIGVDYTATAVYNDANAGTNKSAEVTASMRNSDRANNYVLTVDTYTVTGQTIKKAEIDVTAIDIAEKTYDGDADAELIGITFEFNGMAVDLVKDTDYTAEAVFTDPNAGTGKTVSVTVSLKNTTSAGNFTVSEAVEFDNFEILKAAAPTVEDTDVSFAWGEIGEHSVTIPTLPDDLGEVFDVSADITDDGDIISDVVSVDNGTVTFTLNENAVDNIGDSAIVEIVVETQNYEDITALVTIVIADKEQPQEPECNITFMQANDGTFTAVIEQQDGAEYKFNDGEWSTSNTVSGLGYNNTVTGYIRLVETDTHYGSSEVSATATTPKDTVKTPVIVPSGETTYYNSQTVIITCATEGASIYYTTDGSKPDANSTLYEGEFVITSSMTVNAVAILDGMNDSGLATAKFTREYYTVKTPVIIPTGDTVFYDSQTVIITCATPGATIYYTTDGSKPTVNSTPYTGEFTVATNTTVNAIAVYEGMLDSEIATAKFTREYYTVKTPVISPAGTTYYGEQLISITCATQGATIYYTIDGSDPTDEYSTRKVYDGPFEIKESMTVKAYAVADDMYDSAVASEVYVRDLHTVKSPVISPATSIYYNSQTVVITCATKEATIHYTTDGSVPTSESPVYTGPFEITATTIVKAVAVADDMYDSAVVTETLTREFYTVETPVITPADGSEFVLSQTVTISCATEGATIYYTTDGTMPTIKSEKYTKPFTVTATTTVKAYAVATEMYDSAVASAKLTRKIVPAATPVITPVDGTAFAGAQTVTITCATEGATIYYTTNGSEPTTKSRKYTGPFGITATTTIKAFAVCDKIDDSAVATAKLTKQVIASAKTVATPTFMPGDGSEFGSVEYVTINCATEGVMIFYTTDGSTPTTSSSRYTGNITLTKTTTIKAIAVHEGMNDSAVATARFTKYTPSGSTGGSTGGSGSSGGSGGGSSGGTGGGTTADKAVPSIHGNGMSWPQIVDVIKNDYKGGTVTIELNGNQSVPEYVIKALADAECVVTFEVDGTTSWIIDGNDVKKPAKADLTITNVVRNDTQKLDGDVGRQFKISNVNAPVQLSINFKKSNQFKFADLYRWNGTKYVYVCSARITKDGTATLPYVESAGYYTVMINNELHGDVNGDGKVNVLDASAILMKIAGIALPKNPEEVDYNIDGVDSVADASAILKMLISTISSDA